MNCCWFDRRSGQVDSFDANPKISYYKFLRAVYQMTAIEAYNEIQKCVRYGMFK